MLHAENRNGIRLYQNIRPRPCGKVQSEHICLATRFTLLWLCLLLAKPPKNTDTGAYVGNVSTTNLTSISGYLIIYVESMQAALAVATTCSLLNMGSTLDVSELLEMDI